MSNDISKKQREEFAKSFLETYGFSSIEILEERLASLSETISSLEKISEDYWEIHG